MYRITIQEDSEQLETINCEGYALLANCGSHATELIQHMNLLKIAAAMTASVEVWNNAARLAKVLKEFARADKEDKDEGISSALMDALYDGFADGIGQAFSPDAEK